MTKLLQMPIWTCPSCEKQQQHDDYYDLHTDDTLMCGYCEAEFPITEREDVMYLTINTVPQKATP